MLRLIALSLVIASSAFAADEGAVGRIAYIDPVGDLYVVRPDGSDRRALSTEGNIQPVAFSVPIQESVPEFYSWPVWSPDAERVAVFHTRPDRGGVVSALQVFDVESGRIVRTHAEPRLGPIYAYWAPTGRRLAVLLQNRGRFRLSLWPGLSSTQPELVAEGVPLFFDWNRDGRRIALHAANDPKALGGHAVSVLPATPGPRRVLTDRPGPFGPPSWSGDGEWLAYVDWVEMGKADVVVERRDGSDRKAALRVDAKTAFNWSPTKPALLVGTTSRMREPMIEKLELVTLPSGDTKVIAEDLIGAFFWSPDGKRVLYARRDLERGDWEWVVVDVDRGESASAGRFLPSGATLFVFQYFDQYALSHRIWSPDGRQFTFAGFSEASPGPEPKVFVVALDREPPISAIADGHTAFWSPK